ncbi:hypothetical protein BKA83DRAFT_11401 [Pisolithus microcarpus]|nr:hypothetical protein BKA83DRAFT_11401 [Pisolithus microcarpus]
MSSAVYPVPNGPRNVLQTTHNILATENVTVTQLWATTLVPTSPPVSASVMLVAPQHRGHFPWFLIKSPIINFVRSLQPTPVEHDLRMLVLTWADRAKTVQFSVEGKTFVIFFCDPAMFWCFKCMVHCRDQVDRHRHHVPELNAKVLLDAFLDFKIPAEVPLGIRSTVLDAEVCEQHANSSLHDPAKYHDKGVSASTDQGEVTASVYSQPQSPTSEGGGNHEDAERRLDTPQCQSTAMDDGAGTTGERAPGPIVSDMRPAADVLATHNSLHTSRSQSIVMGDNASGTSEPVQSAVDALLYLSADSPTNQWTDRCSQPLDPIDLGEGSTAGCDVTVRPKKRKFI